MLQAYRGGLQTKNPRVFFPKKKTNKLGWNKNPVRAPKNVSPQKKAAVSPGKSARILDLLSVPLQNLLQFELRKQLLEAVCLYSAVACFKAHMEGNR